MIIALLRPLAACLLSFVLCALIYPAAAWLVGQALFPAQAEGSLIRGADEEVIGSALIAQPSPSDRYFHPRPSAVDFNASAAGGSNLAATNPDLRAQVAGRAAALGASADDPAPLDLVTASGSGLDPDITPEAARYQVARIARARGVPPRRVRDLIDARVDASGAILGAPGRVNVLLLNLALDADRPIARTR